LVARSLWPRFQEISYRVPKDGWRSPAEHRHLWPAENSVRETEAPYTSFAGEAEAMADVRIPDIRVTNQIAGADQIARLIALRERAIQSPNLMADVW
jgi:hypothetical protein